MCSQASGDGWAILIGAIADFADPEEDRAAERILLIAPVQSDVTAATQFRVLQPFERKQSPF
jgi:hypothetical protein